jgi:hypothetical protein
MRSNAIRGLTVVVLGFIALPLLAAPEDDVRDAFQALQKAIKAKDTDAIWGLLDKDSQSDANRAAKAVQAAFGKASDDKAKADFEKRYGLSAKELGDMNGKLFVKSNRFQGKYHELPGSKIDKITVKGEKAQVNYTEEDGDKEMLKLVRAKDGPWKAVMPMPKAVD